MQKPVDLSVIVVTWNSEAWLRRCLRSVFAEKGELQVEVIMVDNASSDRSAQVAMNEFSGVRIVQNQSNLGFAAAVNRGIAVSTGRYVCLLNPDTELTDHALERMVEAMDRDPGIGVMGPHLLNEDKSTQASVRRFPTGADQTLILSKLHLLFRDSNALNRYLMRGFDYKRTQDVDQVMGACFMIRRETIDQVGVFDETFFIWFEEVDYCRRVKETSSFRVVYFAQAHVIHLGGESFAKVSAGKKRRWYTKSVRYYFRKHKQWGAYVACVLVAPLSWVLGLFVSGFSKTKRGSRSVLEAQNKRKHID
jgi:GT2 family glycosyltransferase